MPAKEFKPLIVSFCCNWCSYAGADLAGSSRLEYPAEVKIIRIPCSCRVDPLFVLRAFQRGADGVIINGCHPGDCHYSTGNYYTRRRMTLLFSMLDYLGIEQERTRLEWVSAAEGVRFASVMNEFVGKIYELGECKNLDVIRNKNNSGTAIKTLAVQQPPEVSGVSSHSVMLENEMCQKASEFMNSGAVDAVLGWAKGELSYDAAPMLFQAPDSLQNMVHNGFCGSNLSKYLVENSNKKTLAFLKPCDTYSLNQLISENRVNRKNIHVVGIGCNGMLDIEKLRSKGVKGILEISENGDNLLVKTMYGDETYPRKDALLEKCLSCKGKEHMVYDELLGIEAPTETLTGDKFLQVAELEAMSSNERFAYWRSQLSKCIRCNACRNACPACTCRKCLFDNPHSGVSAKVSVTEAEENLFHIIRAYHVAGRCSDCGECTRVCPQAVPLHLLNRKFIKDINTYYGQFQAGETAEQNSPLLHFSLEDPEPSIVSKGGK